MSISPRNHAPTSIFLLLPAIALLLVGTFSLRAQAAPGSTRSSVAARLTQPIQESAVVTLRGNTHPLAQARYDRGPAPASTPATRMLLVLRRSDQQEADLKAYLTAVQTVGSPSYHKFLTPEQFGALYGPADADIQTVSTWLQGHGLAVSKVNKAKTVLEFSGNFAQLQQTFHTPIHTYLIDGEQHFANTSDPQIPAALAPVVSGLARMNNFKVKNQAVPGPRGKFNPETRAFQRELTGGSASDFLYVGPSDAATIYNSPITGLNKNFAGGTTYDGTGVNIGVIGDANIDIAGVANYRSLFGLPANAPNVIVDGDDPGVGDIYNTDTGEALLDVEISSGIAPGAKVNLYVAAGTALQAGIDIAGVRAIDDNLVSVLNLSFGGCEAFLGTTGNSFYYALWEEAAAQGISVTVSTGDDGSAGCDRNVDFASNGLQVNGLGSTPFNIAVGGTDFDILASSSSFKNYVDSTNPAPYLGTAKSFIPENPWNNSTEPNQTISANVAFTDPNSGKTNIVAASGGQSSCVQSSVSNNLIHCAGGYAKPSWQKVFDNGDGVRDLPDVSMFASNGFYAATWAICATGTEGGTSVNDCQLSAGQISSITGFGGTSASSPAFAGVLAIINQKVGGRLGQANQVLYPLAKQKPAAFHDVTVGNISVPCPAGSPNCGANHFLTGFDTKPGYDLATGLGSVDITQLANNWSSVTFAPSATALTLNSSTAPLAIAHGTSVTAGVTVTSGGGTPTGDVSILNSLDPAANPNSVAITQPSTGPLTLGAGGTATQTFTSLPGGTYNVTAHYAGDGVIAASDSAPISVTVTPESSKVKVAATIYDTTSTQVSVNPIPYGFITVVDATPVSATATAGDGNATGTIGFSGSGITSSTSNLNSQGFSEIQTVTIPPGNQTISAAYSGDKSFSASTGTVTLAVAQGVTTTAATASAPTVASTATFTMSAAIATNSFGTPPTGTVTFSAGSTTLATATVNGAHNSTTFIDNGTATSAAIPANLLAAGANNITAVYSGDTNYAASTSAAVTVTVTAGGAAPTFTVTTPNITIAHGATTGNTAAITITPVNSYNGTVALKCAITSSPAGAQDLPGCSVSPASVVVGSTPVTATLTISSTATSALHFPGDSPFRFGWATAGGTALACVALFGIPARRKGWKAILALTVFATLASFAGGCGGGSSNGGGGNHNPGTTTGAYTVTVTGTDSVTATTTASAVVTVTIN